LWGSQSWLQRLSGGFFAVRGFGLRHNRRFPTGAYPTKSLESQLLHPPEGLAVVKAFLESTRGAEGKIYVDYRYRTTEVSVVRIRYIEIVSLPQLTELDAPWVTINC
jgi:hypothetical protein